MTDRVEAHNSRRQLKKTYVAPTLKRHGKLQDLTRKFGDNTKTDASCVGPGEDRGTRCA